MNAAVRPDSFRPSHFTFFGLKDEMQGRMAADANDEVRHILMQLAVLQVRYGESEPGAFYESFPSYVLPNNVCR